MQYLLRLCPNVDNAARTSLTVPMRAAKKGQRGAQPKHQDAGMLNSDKIHDWESSMAQGKTVKTKIKETRGAS